jgi:HAE1 family hydrophobic/amphiphilic exporter-1
VNLSENFIRRPVMTVLLSASCVVAGVLAYGDIPIAALPKFETPTISVTGVLPGASPENMAAAVATPLEKQFATIAGLDTISSTSTQGRTQVTLEFTEGRAIDAAAVDVQAALLRASRQLPPEMTNPPSYRKVNPADAPIIFVALTSPSMPMSELNALAENLIAPSLSTISGVAEIDINGRQRFAVRVKVRPDALASRNLTVDDVAAAIRLANPITPVGTLEGGRQTLTIQANRQMMHGAEFAKIIVATLPQRGDGAPRGRGRGAGQRGAGEGRELGETERAITLLVRRQPDANTVRRWTRSARPAAARRADAGLGAAAHPQRPLGVDPRRDPRREDHARHHRVPRDPGDLPFLRRPSATIIPALSAADLAHRHARADAGAGSQPRQRVAARHHARVGLVVDDAIVMLENIVRHVEEGMEPFEAALRARARWASPSSRSRISLVAVFIPTSSGRA